MVTIKCANTLFSKEGLITNIGSYIILFIIVYFAVSSILFYKVGYVLLENDIQSILKANIIDKNKRKGKKLSIYNYNKNSKRKNKIKETIEVNNPKYPPKKKKKKSNSKSNENVAESKLKLKDVKIVLNFQEQKENKSKKNKKPKIYRIKKKIKEKLSETISKPLTNINYNNDYIEYELNTFPYKKALEYDKRTFSQYYISLIRTKHPIISSFIPIKDYNTMIIKLCLFFLSFSINYFVNAFFFNENTIHQIYEDGGVYNLGYFIQQIFLSFLISHFFSIILRYVFLSERNIIQIKKQNQENISNEIQNVKRKLIIKYIIFFTVGLLFLIFFWYYLSSFGAVYKNSQVYVIKNTFICFAISLLYPFIINIIPAILRIYSLNDKNKKRENWYNISKFIQIL